MSPTRNPHGAALRIGNLRLQAEDPDALLHSWRVHWPFPNLKFLGFNKVEPDMEDVFQAYSRGYYRTERDQVEPAKMAYKFDLLERHTGDRL